MYDWRRRRSEVTDSKEHCKSTIVSYEFQLSLDNGDSDQGLKYGGRIFRCDFRSARRISGRPASPFRARRIRSSATFRLNFMHHQIAQLLERM